MLEVEQVSVDTLDSFKMSLSWHSAEAWHGHHSSSNIPSSNLYHNAPIPWKPRILLLPKDPNNRTTIWRSIKLVKDLATLTYPEEQHNSVLQRVHCRLLPQPASLLKTAVGEGREGTYSYHHDGNESINSPDADNPVKPRAGKPRLPTRDEPHPNPDLKECCRFLLVFQQYT